MKKNIFYAALSLTALLSLSECCKKNDPSPEAQLPPATQEGRNAFGCLLNGQAWTPSGYNGSPNYSVAYDPTYDGGTFDLRTYRYPSGNANSSDQQHFILYANNLSQVGTYDFANKQKSRVSLNDRKTGCDYSSRDNQTYCKGTLTITRLDLAARVISGTFEFMLYKPGCDTIKVTQGRFDKKL